MKGKEFGLHFLGNLRRSFKPRSDFVKVVGAFVGE